MATRYIGDAKITIRYRDEGDYAGTVTAGGERWKFDGLRAPAIGFDFAYDSPEAYDRMAGSAVSFGSSSEITGSRDVSEAISNAAWDMDDSGDYNVKRRKPR